MLSASLVKLEDTCPEHTHEVTYIAMSVYFSEDCVEKSLTLHVLLRGGVNTELGLASGGAFLLSTARGAV